MTVQASLFHEIIDLTELYLFFSDQMVIVKIMRLFVEVNHRDFSIAVESKQLIHIIR